MEGLDISKVPMDLLLNLLNIFLLYIIIRTLVYKPVKKFLDARIEKVNALAQKAEDTQSEADKLKDKYEKLLAEADDKSNEIILASQKRASEEAAVKLEEAKKEAQAFFGRETAKIEEERKASMKTIRKEAAALAVEISKKILEREINDTDNRRIAEAFFMDSDEKK